MDLKSYLQARHTASSAKRYLHAIDYFLSRVAGAETVGFNQIMEHVGDLRQKYSNAETVKTALAGIKKYYHYLIETGQREDHPCRDLYLRDQNSKDIQLQDLFTEVELGLLLSRRKERYPQMKTRNQVVLGLLIYQGLTTGEIIGLKLSDIDLETAEVRVQSSNRQHGRVLKLRSEQIMLFYQYLNEDRLKLLKQTTDQLIVTHRGSRETGEGISYLVGTMKYLFPDRKLDPKTIRQSVVANLLKSGKDLRLVQVFAGHKYPSTTERYRASHIEELVNHIQKYHPLNEEDEH